jgi:CheY-like chemotaxis protein
MSPKPEGSICSILLVEDHADTAMAIRTFLSSLGHSVVTADSVEAAVREVVARHFDVIVSDVGLPDGNGLSLINCIRPFCKSPAIALTGFGSAEDAERCKAAGFDLHLAKPADPEKLKEAIQQVRPATEA